MALLWLDGSRTNCDEVHEERTGKAYQGRFSAPNVPSALLFWTELDRGNYCQFWGHAISTLTLLFSWISSFTVRFAPRFISYYSLWTISHLMTNLLSSEEYLWPVSLARARCMDRSDHSSTVLGSIKHILFIHLRGLLNCGRRLIPGHATTESHLQSVWRPSHPEHTDWPQRFKSGTVRP